MKIVLNRVRFMPADLEPGVLYVAEEFRAAAHLCACGCGAKIRTPLGPAAWQLEETPDGPTLTPSVGNWQQRCRTHYWIFRGEIHWSEPWTDEEIALGREFEEERRERYYKAQRRSRRGLLRRAWDSIKEWVGTP